MKLVRKNVVLRPVVAEELDRMAEEAGFSVSQVVDMLTAGWLEVGSPPELRLTAGRHEVQVDVRMRTLRVIGS